MAGRRMSKKSIQVTNALFHYVGCRGVWFDLFSPRGRCGVEVVLDVIYYLGISTVSEPVKKGSYSDDYNIV